MKLLIIIITLIVYIAIHGFMLYKLTYYNFQGKYDSKATQIYYKIFPFTACGGFIIIVLLSLFLIKQFGII